ncbi:MAG: UDP-N-acetylmuramate dehydrogenase [Chloroflexota bacterium]
MGGPADFFATARSETEMADFVRRAWALSMPVFVMGNGSNILLADKGIRGLVIRNLCTAVTYERADGEARARHLRPDPLPTVEGDGLVVRAESGAMLPRLGREAIKLGFHDLVYATGIPGTVGGAVMSNAGAYGWCMGDNLRAVRYLARDGQIRTAGRAELGLGYRQSRFKASGEIVLGAELGLCRTEAPERSAELNRKRRESQPLTMPNAGSMFKNPPDAAAGHLIEQAGLKGRRAGNAQISEKHANFIVNLGGARATDVLSLIELARSSVNQPLELEVRLVGEWP